MRVSKAKAELKKKCRLKLLIILWHKRLLEHIIDCCAAIWVIHWPVNGVVHDSLTNLKHSSKENYVAMFVSLLTDTQNSAQRIMQGLVELLKQRDFTSLA